MHKISMLAAALVIAAPIAADAAAPQYNYLDLSYSQTSLTGNSGGKGYQLDGSYGFDSKWFVGGSYGQNSFDSGVMTGGFFTHGYTLTIGGHLPITDAIDFVGRISYASDTWIQGPSTNVFPGFVVAINDTRSGYDVGFGIRAMVIDRLELDAYLDQNDVGLVSHYHNSNEFVESAAALYDFTSQFGLGVSYAHSNQQGANNWMLTGRWYFRL